MLSENESKRNRALKYVYEQNRNAVFSFILANSGSEEDAQDIYQEAMIVFYENIRKNKFKGESTIATYLFSIAKFKWFNEIKKEKSKVERHLKLETETYEVDPSKKLIAKEEKERVMGVFDQLKGGCKELLISSFYYDKGIKDLVSDLGFSSDQIARNKKYKCLKALRSLMENNKEILQILKGHA